MPYYTETAQDLLREIAENCNEIENAADGVRKGTQDEKLQDEMCGIQVNVKNIADAAQYLKNRIEELEYELGQRR